VKKIDRRARTRRLPTVRRLQISGDLEHSRVCVGNYINGDVNGGFKLNNFQRSVFDTCLKRSPLRNTVTKLGLTENTRGRNRAESERSYIEQDNSFLLAMGDGALPNPYPEENPYLVRLPASMCTSVTDDEAGMSDIVREVYGGLPTTNDDTEFLVDRTIICPLNTQVDRVTS
jgi:hypothetical protein